jgi:putative ABC transport system substrate-binding protein
VGSGLVTSLGRPGGNATGISILIPEMSGKQLELLKAATPKTSRVAVLYNPANPAAGDALNATRDTARSLSLELQLLEVRQPRDFAGAFAAAAAGRAGALLVLPDPVLGNDLDLIARLAVSHHLPAMYVRREFAETGGLLAYGPSFQENYRRAATYVDKILKGANPADLPVEQPIKFEFIVNLKAAKQIGLTIPPNVLARADRVIK